MKRAAYMMTAFLMAAGVGPLFAASRSGADFLKIPVGARAAALGQAFTAMADGAAAVHWNMAGIARHNGHRSVEFSRTSFISDTDLDSFAVALPARRWAFGFSMERLSYPSQEKRDVDRDVVGSVDASDMALGLGLAGTAGPLQVGGQLKYLSQILDGVTADGFAVDLGLMAPSPIRGLTVGVSARNLGPPMKYEEVNLDLPLTISGGVAYQLARPFVVALDVHARPHQDQVAAAFGMQFIPMGLVTIRAGYLYKLASTIRNPQRQESDRGTLSGGLNGLAGGLGLRLGILSLDYAFSPIGELGDSQTLSLSARF